MILDSANPEHREALRWAREFAAADIEAACRFVANLPTIPQEIRLPEDEPRNEALVALLAPSDSAAIVRALLEGCGINAHVEQWPMTTDGDYVVMWNVNDGAYNHGSHVEVTRDMSKMPTLVLRLLACTSKEEALAALREVGR